MSQVRILSFRPKINAEWYTFCIYFLSKSQTWYIITARSVVDIISSLGCISSRHSRAYPFLRFDDMQHFVLVICNFYEIDDMQGLRLDFIAKKYRLVGKIFVLQAFFSFSRKIQIVHFCPFRSLYAPFVQFMGYRSIYDLLNKRLDFS